MCRLNQLETSRKLKGVLVSVVRDDMDIRGGVCHLRLDADEAAGDMAAIENPIHGIAGEHIGDLLLCWEA